MSLSLTHVKNKNKLNNSKLIVQVYMVTNCGRQRMKYELR